MRREWLWAVVGAWGCAAPTWPLGEVPIVAGSAAQRDAVRSALLAFEEAVGPGRVVLREVRLDGRGLEPSYLGGYAYELELVTLAPDLRPEAIGWVLRHELCHALDWQEALITSPIAPEVARLAPIVVPSPPEEPDDPDHIHRETFARTCDEGAWVAALLSAPCPGDPVDVAALFAWMSEHTWVREEGFPEHDGETLPVRRWSTGFTIVPSDALTVSTIEVNDEVPIFSMEVEGEQDVRHNVDPYTGERPDYGGATHLVMSPVRGDLDPTVAIPFDGGELVDPHGWDGGPAIALARVDLGPVGVFERVVVRGADGVWRRAPSSCPDPVRALVALDRLAWYVWGEGEAVSWVGFDR